MTLHTHHPRRISPVVAAIALVFIMSWLISRNVVIRMPSLHSFPIASRIAPDLFAPSPFRKAITPRERATFLDRLREMARHAPLSSVPLREAATVASEEGRYIEALNMLRLARDADPRDGRLRLQLAGEMLRVGQIAAVIPELDTAMRVDPKIISQIAPLMPTLATPGAGERALSKALARQPVWRSFVVRDAKNRAYPPRFVFEAIKFAASPGGTGRPAEQAHFLKALLARGETETAFLAFLNFLPPEMVSRVKPVYDGSFEGLPGPVPFNWSLSSGRVDGATIKPAGDGLLMLDFFSDRNYTLASQTMLLSPGHYRLVTHASTRSATPPGVIGWNVTCAPIRAPGALLARVHLNGLVEIPQAFDVTFTVPGDGCTTQQLSLRFVRHERPAREEVDIHDVSVTRVVQ